MSNEHEKMTPLEAALILTDCQANKINRLTGDVEAAMIVMTEHLGHNPRGSDLLFVLTAEVRRLREENAKLCDALKRILHADNVDAESGSVSSQEWNALMIKAGQVVAKMEGRAS